MKIVIFGVSGRAGSRIAHEALQRGYSMTGVVHRAGTPPVESEKVHIVTGDVLDPDSVAKVAKGRDAVVNAVAAPDLEDREFHLKAARSLIAGLKKGGVRRLIVVGGAGSLEVAPGVQLVDSPGFPSAWKTVALSHRDALKVYQDEADLDWTYISPAAYFEPGERKGHYRTDSTRLLTDEKGESRISMEDYAIALVDELENGRLIRQRVGVAW
jgi:uncharacterized protein